MCQILYDSLSFRLMMICKISGPISVLMNNLLMEEVQTNVGLVEKFLSR